MTMTGGASEALGGGRHAAGGWGVFLVIVIVIIVPFLPVVPPVDPVVPPVANVVLHILDAVAEGVTDSGHNVLRLVDHVGSTLPQSIVEVGGTLPQSVVEAGGTLPQGVVGSGDEVARSIRDVGRILPESVVEVGRTICQSVVEVGRPIPQSVVEVGCALPESVVELGPTLCQSVVQAIDKVLRGADRIVSNLLAGIRKVLADLLGPVCGVLSDVLLEPPPPVVRAAVIAPHGIPLSRTELVHGDPRGASEALGGGRPAAGGWRAPLGAVGDGALDGFVGVGDKVPDLLRSGLDGFVELRHRLLGLVRDCHGGIVQLAAQVGRKLLRAVQDFAAALVEAVRNLLGGLLGLVRQAAQLLIELRGRGAGLGDQGERHQRKKGKPSFRSHHSASLSLSVFSSRARGAGIANCARVSSGGRASSSSRSIDRLRFLSVNASSPRAARRVQLWPCPPGLTPICCFKQGLRSSNATPDF